MLRIITVFVGILLFLSGCAVDNQIQGDFNPEIADDPDIQNFDLGQFSIVSGALVNGQTGGGYRVNLSLGTFKNTKQVTGGGYKVDLSVTGGNP